MVWPSLMMGVPLTMTWRMPLEKLRPFSNVAVSRMVAGLNTVMSASAPRAMRPLFFIWGEMGSRRLAGAMVILVNASMRERTFSSLT